MAYPKEPMSEFTFQQVYGRPFPAGNVTAYPDKGTSHFRISFRTPNRVVREFGFHATSGTLPPQLRMGGTVMMRLLDADGNLLLEREGNMQGFVNDVDEWPRQTDIDVVTAARFEGQMDGRDLNEAPRPDWMLWLKPRATYVLEVERLEGHNERQPVPLKFTSFGMGASLGTEEPTAIETSDTNVTDVAVTLENIAAEILRRLDEISAKLDG